MDAIETFKVNGYTVKIVQDEFQQSPRDPRWTDGNLGVFVDWHRRDQYGDRKAEDNEINAVQRGGLPLLKRYLRRTQGAICVLPVSLLSHSGDHIWVGAGAHASDPGGWDSGTVGFIYATAERCAELGVDQDAEAETEIEIGFRTITATVNNVEAQLRGEIRELDAYYQGDAYAFIIQDADGDTVESCGGFLACFDECKAEARSMAEGLPKPTRYAIHIGKGRTFYGARNERSQ